MSYTIKNLRETEDKAPGFGLSEIQEAHFPAGELGAESTGLAFQVIHPGRRQGFAHRHENAEEIYVVLAGSGKIKLDDETVEVGPLDAIRVAPAVTRAFEAGPDGLELIAFGPRHEGDGEIIREGFWAD
jgi:mannose-6-phosphate isomerase-like protein (cupin superfamily)